MPKVPTSIKIANKVLRGFFNFHTPLIDRQMGIWELNNEYSIGSTSDEKGNNYTLWIFPIKKELSNVSQNYPLYFSFNLKMKDEDEISEINIKIFKEDTAKIIESYSIILAVSSLKILIFISLISSSSFIFKLKEKYRG